MSLTTRDRPLSVRRISFRFGEKRMPQHFMADDLVMSHLVAVLSALFPEGEDYFVRSVRNYRGELTDPTLKSQVAAFIGQEAIHGREHRTLNERLQQMGYPSALVDRVTRSRLHFNEKVAPPRIRLAVTAALEHYTATLAEVLLGSPEAQAMFSSDEILSLLLWHAVEESEHKAVAFDVFQEVCGDHRVRTRTMNAVTVGFLAYTALFTAYSLARDPAARDLRRVGRDLANLRRSPWLDRSVRRRIRDYNRPDFHPDDHDADELLGEWREKLFGDHGQLVGLLAG